MLSAMAVGMAGALQARMRVSIYIDFNYSI